MPIVRGVYPPPNPILEATWKRQDQQGHKKRLGEVKSVVVTVAPKVYPHLIHRNKKEMMLEERYTQIERDNRLLLSKMNAILKTSNIDNINNQQPKSLNSWNRKKELERIMDSNLKILEAIQNKKGSIDSKEWAKHEKDYIRFKKNAMKGSHETRPLPTLYDKESRRNHSAPNPRTLEPLKKKEIKQWKGSVTLSNGPATISGKSVTLVVKEFLSITAHKLVFIVTSSDVNGESYCEVEWESIEAMMPEKLLKPVRRRDLVKELTTSLKIQDGKLLFALFSGGPSETASAAEKEKLSDLGIEASEPP